MRYGDMEGEDYTVMDVVGWLVGEQGVDNIEKKQDAMN